MKYKIIKRTSFLLFAIFVIVISAASLSSCGNNDYNDFLDALTSSLTTESTSATTGTTEVITTTDTTDTANTTSTSASADTYTTSGGITQNITNTTITITGNDSNRVYAAAMGLRSAVSIYCTFETTSGGWRPSTKTYYSTGSGVIYELCEDGSAFIVTNHHVVYDSSSNTENGISDKIYLYLYGLESEAYAIPATYVGGSANYDLAVLRVDASEVLKNAYGAGAAAAVVIGNSDEVYPGQTAIAVGNPSSEDFGGISVTSGIVSVASEYITMTSNTGRNEVTLRVIRTDTPMNSGNSGGGFYNDKGELIGIVNAKYVSSDIDDVGYAIPSSVVRAVADNIIDYCYGKDCESVMRYLTGITAEVSGYDTYFDTEKGVLVQTEEVSVAEITEGKPSEAVFALGDVIKSISIGDNTVTVTRFHHLIDAMLDLRVGDTVSFEIVRDGTETLVSLVVTEDSLSAH